MSKNTLSTNNGPIFILHAGFQTFFLLSQLQRTEKYLCDDA